MDWKNFKIFVWGNIFVMSLCYLASCSSTRNSVPTKEPSVVIETDSSNVGFVMNDSLLCMVNNADSLSIYELYSPLFTNDTTQNIELDADTIAYFRMKRDSALVSAEMTTILKFIVGDKNVYQEDVPVAKQPYSPYIGIRFWSKGKDVILLYSFSTNQLAFATKDEILLICRIKDWYSLERWLHQILPENDYINSMINKQ